MFQRARRRGATVVEFAVVVPIFFLLLFAGIEFATLGTIRSTAHNAAYEGARKLVIPGALASEGIDEAKRVLGVVGVDVLTVTTTPSVITDDTQQVTLTVSIPYDSNAVFVPYFTGGLTIQSSVTLKTERYGGIATTP
ncbi:MAG: pilus assembly protein [Fuerstiella sp.]